MRADINYSDIIDSDEARIAQAAADKAPFLPSAEIDPYKFFITQDTSKYTQEDNDVWRIMFTERMKSLADQASDVFLTGLEQIGLVPERVPRVADINRRLQDLTGWESHPVPGYLPAKSFFACLAARRFPTTITMRPRELMNYLPEPDIFHDVFGHVPLHADPIFAEFLQTYGKAALFCEDPYHIERLARLFWFTVEFGLIREKGKVKLYGSGLISSIGESFHALESDHVDRRPFDMDRVCDTPFEIDHYQPIL